MRLVASALLLAVVAYGQLPISSTGGSGGAIALADTYANLPAAGTAGRLFYATDSIYWLRDNGSSWDHYVDRMGPLTPPVNGDFAWVNQGTATVDATYGGVILHKLAEAGVQLRIRSKAATPPYTLTAAIYGINAVAGNHTRWGVGFRESATGKLATVTIHPGAQQVYWERWTSPTAFDSIQQTHFAGHTGASRLLRFRLGHDGTNLTYSWSIHPAIGFVQLGTETKANWFTTDPDEIFFYADSQTAAWPVQIWVVGWAEE